MDVVNNHHLTTIIYGLSPAYNHPINVIFPYSICSMYGRFTSTGPKDHPNVGKHTSPMEPMGMLFMFLISNADVPHLRWKNDQENRIGLRGLQLLVEALPKVRGWNRSTGTLGPGGLIIAKNIYKMCTLMGRG